MPSRFPIAPLLGALIHLTRYEPTAAGPQAALLVAIRILLEGKPLTILAEQDILLLDDEAIPLSVPGATLLHEQLRLHGIAAVTLPVDVADYELLRVAGVLAAFAGTYEAEEDLLAAFGASARHVRLLPAAGGVEVQGLSWRTRWSPVPGYPSPLAPLGIQRADADAITFAVPTPAGDAAELSGGLVAAVRPPLGTILERGRRAVEREDWVGLLDAGLQLMEAEDEAPSDRTGDAYRTELKRLVSREHLGMIARLAQGDRRQEAIGLLRRFGPVATETLVELLVGAANLGERRGYYTAITQMGEGAEAIIGQLDHPLWYVVRNAAELCGDMELAGAVPALGRQIQHPDERVRKSVATALARIATPLALPWLGKLLGDSSPTVRRQALVHLVGPRVSPLCPAISRLLQREGSPEVEREALLALGRIGSPDAIAVLGAWASATQRFGRKPMPVRLLAVRGLALAGPAADAELSALTRDESPEVRAAASAALAAMRP